MTAHVNLSGQIYCALWHEGLVGRSGHDLASAVIICLQNIIKDHSSVENIITWSDSCVPQNRNSIISCAMIKLLILNPNIKSIHMKYSVPGHSCIQEVDNAHSQIEKTLQKLEVWSPLGLVRTLLKVNRKIPFKIIQMRQDNFKNYYIIAKQYRFNLVPYASVAQLFFIRTNLSIIQYKLCHGFNDFDTIDLNVQNRKPSISRDLVQELSYIIPVSNLKETKLTKEKIIDIESLFKFMPEYDIEFYKALFKNHK